MLSLSRKQIYCRSTTASNLVRYTKHQNLQRLSTNKPSPSTILRRYHAGYLPPRAIEPVSYTLPSCKAYSTAVTKSDAPNKLPDQSVSTSKKDDADADEHETKEGKGLTDAQFVATLFGGVLILVIALRPTHNPERRAASSKAQKEADLTRFVRSIPLTEDEIRVAMLCRDVIIDSIQTLTREKLAPFEQMRRDIKQKKQQKQQQTKQLTQQETQQQKQQQKHQKATKKGDLVDPMPGWFWGGR